MKSSHHRELDVPATPRADGGEKQPQQPNLSGGRNREGVGNLISGDKTLLESPERSVASNRSGGRPVKSASKNRKKPAA